MTTKVGIEGTNLTASQLVEFFRLAALPDSHINRVTVQAFIERRNPFESVVAGLPLPEGTVTRRVKVDRTRTPQEVVDATGRVQYLNKEVLATMPQGEGDEVDVYFVPTKRFVSASEVSAFLAQYGLVPDPRAQTAVNEADPSFADDHPNGSQWGDNCYLTFLRWDVERHVRCYRYDYDWLDYWFLSGVPTPRK